MTTQQLFNRLPESIRQKIYILYLGFGTQPANMIKTEIKKMKNLSNADFTLWRFIIMNRTDDIGVLIVSASLPNKQMRPNILQLHSGWVAVYELEFAYKSSPLCIMNTRRKFEKLNIIKEVLNAHFIEHFRLI